MLKRLICAVRQLRCLHQLCPKFVLLKKDRVNVVGTNQHRHRSRNVDSPIVKFVEVCSLAHNYNPFLVLKDDMQWITTKQAKVEEDKAIERFALNQIGLNPEAYKFDRKASQLDGTISLLSQILDDRLQAER